MNNQTIETLKKIAAKCTLGLPLTEHEKAMWTLYGYYINTDAARDEQESKNKAAFVRKNLAPMLRAAGVDVADVVYQIDKRTREETVTLTYTCGATRDVCVTADSLIALTTDVISKL